MMAELRVNIPHDAVMSRFGQSGHADAYQQDGWAGTGSFGGLQGSMYYSNSLPELQNDSSGKVPYAFGMDFETYNRVVIMPATYMMIVFFILACTMHTRYKKGRLVTPWSCCPPKERRYEPAAGESGQWTGSEAAVEAPPSARQQSEYAAPGSVAAAPPPAVGSQVRTATEGSYVKGGGSLSGGPLSGPGVTSQSSVPGALPPPGSLPPGSLPPGSLPPGSVPPAAGSAPGSVPGSAAGSVPPGSAPGSVPPGSVPPGSAPPGSAPGSVASEQPGSAKASEAAPPPKEKKVLPYERIATPGMDPYLWSPPATIFQPSPTPPGTPFDEVSPSGGAESDVSGSAAAEDGFLPRSPRN